MCLDRLSQFDVPNEGIGYKCLHSANDEKNVFRSPTYRSYDNYIVGREYQANKSRITTGLREDYTTGFHIFVNQQDAEIYSEYGDSICKVQYRNVLHTGLQNRMDCIISEYMTVLEEVKYMDDEAKDYYDDFDDDDLDDDDFDDEDWEDDDLDEVEDDEEDL